MRKEKYTIRKKSIQKVSLISPDSQNWMSSTEELIPWNGDTYIGPSVNDVVYNTNDTNLLNVGYYKWNGSSWVTTTKSLSLETNHLPIFLESSLDEMGVMVGFDGNIEQVEQLCNFSYKQTGSTITVYNTVNPDKLRKIVEQTYTISWGDGNTSPLSVNLGVTGQNLPTAVHTYTSAGNFTISVSLDSPWSKEKIKKSVMVPQNISVSNPLGSFTGVTLPSYSQTSHTQNYIENLDNTNVTGNTIINFAAFGKSRIDELKKYGSNNYISGTITTGTTSEGVIYSAYTLDNLYYKDYPDNVTMITGSTSNFQKEEVFNKMLTRNEHFIGFIDDPIIYSDVFVERGKQGVMENNHRLGEIGNVGELDIYGNGYFRVKKQ
jgi:hypothetical protein